MYDFNTLNTKPPHRHVAKSPFNATDFHFKKEAEKRSICHQKMLSRVWMLQGDLIHKEFPEKSCTVLQWKLVVYSKKSTTYTKYWDSYRERSNFFFDESLFI